LAQSLTANFGPEVLTGPGAAVDDAGALGSEEAAGLSDGADAVVLDDDDAHPTKLTAMVAAVADSMRRERVRDFIDTLTDATGRPMCSRVHTPREGSQRELFTR